MVHFKVPDWAGDPQQGASLHPHAGNELLSEAVQLDQKPTYTVGRDAHKCDITIAHSSVSRIHAGFVHHTEGRIYLIDNMSTHGTFVNGKRIEGHKPLHLRDGYKIQFGGDKNNKFIFRCDEVKRKLNDQSSDQDYIQIQQELQQLEKEREENQNGNLTQNNDNNNNNPKRVKIDENFQFLGPPKEIDNSADEYQTNYQNNNNNINNYNNNINNNNNNRVEQIQASHILIKHRNSRKPSSWLEDNITRSEEEAVQIAIEMREKLMAGEIEFSKLAEQSSHCSSRKRGGDLKKFGRGKMRPEFEKAAFDLMVGELSEPVKSESGVHLILRTG